MSAMKDKELELIIESLKKEQKLIEERQKMEKLISELKEPKIILPPKPEKIKRVNDLLINFLHGPHGNGFQSREIEREFTTESLKWWERKMFLSTQQLSWLHSMILREVGDHPTCGWSFNICNNLLVTIDNRKWGISVNVLTFTDIPK